MLALRTFFAAITVFLIVVALAEAQQKADSPSKDQLREAIQQLGKHATLELIEMFWAKPEEAARLLIDELKPVKRGSYHSGEHPHTVVCIRALRFLTSLDFRAPTRKNLTAKERNFLDPEGLGKVRFFGTWMSRDSVFVAPVDAQETIIEQWRTWFAKEGRGYKYVKNQSITSWYF